MHIYLKERGDEKTREERHYESIAAAAAERIKGRLSATKGIKDKPAVRAHHRVQLLDEGGHALREARRVADDLVRGVVALAPAVVD